MFFFPLQQKLLVSILINPPSFLSPSDPELSSHFSRFLPSCRRPFRTLAPHERVDSLVPRPPSLRTTTRLALGRQQPASRVLGAASVHVVTIVDFIKANDFARRHRRKSDVDRSLARSLWRRVRSARFRRVREIRSRIRTPLLRIRREPRDRRSLPILRQA